MMHQRKTLMNLRLNIAQLVLPDCEKEVQEKITRTFQLMNRVTYLAFTQTAKYLRTPSRIQWIFIMS